MKKKVIISLSIILAALVTTFIFMVAIPEKKNDAIRQMTINNVDLSKLNNGTYKGEFAYGRYNYKVEVAVSNHTIANIKVEHGRDSKHAKLAEGVINNVISKQAIDVEVISGATTTSKAILKAVEYALSD
jgi:uncharacterized protein with FMN-binding domain